MAACLVLAGSGSASAQAAAVDQSNDPSATTTYGCGSAGTSLYQSFSPAATNVSAVMLRYRVGGSFPSAGATFAAQLREADPTGPVLAASSAVVGGPQTTGASLAVTFHFAPPVPVTPDAVYVIEQVSVAPAGTPAATIASWFGRDDDPYSRGQGFGCSGAAIAQRDHNFVTYALPTVPTPTTPPWPPDGVCWQIASRVPRADIESAVANPTAIEGYGQLERPNLPRGPYNVPRKWLSMRTLAAPYDSLYNGLVYRGGCP